MIASVFTQVYEAVSTEPFSFLLGALVGYLASLRFRIVRVRNGGEDDGRIRRSDRG